MEWECIVERMDMGTRQALALNVTRRAAQLAATDPALIAGLWPARLVELEYELESAGTALSIVCPQCERSDDCVCEIGLVR
jgi:hypothetical protein